MRICLFGASSQQASLPYYDAVRQLGRGLARRKIGLVFGGGATGLMGAACGGAAEENGEIIGVAPRFFDQEGVLFQHCSRLIFTDTMRQRKQQMEDLSDGFIIVPGGIGTLEEFFEILTLRQLGRHQKPIAVLNLGGYYDSLLALLDHVAAEGFTDKEALAAVSVFENAGDLLDYMEQTAYSHCASQAAKASPSLR